MVVSLIPQSEPTGARARETGWTPSSHLERDYGTVILPLAVLRLKDVQTCKAQAAQTSG